MCADVLMVHDAGGARPNTVGFVDSNCPRANHRLRVSQYSSLKCLSHIVRWHAVAYQDLKCCAWC
jgi:hypothetical protein